MAQFRQLRLSKDFQGLQPQAYGVMVFQKTPCGRFVGTLRLTADGFRGHILPPQHSMLPNVSGTGDIGLLHADQRVAYTMLAIQLAKTTWNGQLDFEAACLQGLEDGDKSEFEDWLIGTVAKARANAAIAGGARAYSLGVIKNQVMRERHELLSAINVNRQSGSPTVQ